MTKHGVIGKVVQRIRTGLPVNEVQYVSRAGLCSYCRGHRCVKCSGKRKEGHGIILPCLCKHGREI